jgi:hypothetical protein
VITSPLAVLKQSYIFWAGKGKELWFFAWIRSEQTAHHFVTFCLRYQAAQSIHRLSIHVH